MNKRINIKVKTENGFENLLPSTVDDQIIMSDGSRLDASFLEMKNVINSLNEEIFLLKQQLSTTNGNSNGTNLEFIDFEFLPNEELQDTFILPIDSFDHGRDKLLLFINSVNIRESLFTIQGNVLTILEPIENPEETIVSGVVIKTY